MELFAPTPRHADESQKRSPEGRPQTPYDFNMLKSAQMQQLPRTPSPGPHIMNDSTPPTDSSQQQRPNSASPPTLVRTSPRQLSHLRASLSFKHNPAKRDSGFAHMTDDKRDSSAGSDTASVKPTTSTSPYKPSLPTISPADDARPGSKHVSTSPSQSRKLTKKRQDRVGKGGTSPREAKPRIASFHGIDMDIPHVDLEELHLSDRILFSKRGSVLLNRPAANGEAHEAADPYVTDIVEETSNQSSPNPAQISTPSSEAADRVSGLMPGKRAQPARNAANRHSLRVLSTEETAFSMRVRSLYEQGEEAGVPTIHELGVGDNDHGTEEPSALSVPSGSELPTSRPASVLISRQSTMRSSPPPNTEIDRYGFIVNKATGADSGRPVPIQRVSTTLQLVSQSPRPRRSIRRTLSNSRSVQVRPSPSPESGPAHTLSLSGEPSDASLRSTRRTARPRSRVLQSRGSRLIQDASDMLTLPPGTEEILPHEAESKGSRQARRREVLREEKWRKMAIVSSRGRHGEGMTFDFDTRSDLVVKRTWKGIPDSWRASAWYSFLLASAKRRGRYVTDLELIDSFRAYQEENCADDVQIDIDVPRTIISHVMFRDRYKGGQRLLFRVLHAIALHYPETGYVQGMASLAATLLCYYDEEHAFIMLARLWSLRGMDTLFRNGFDGLMSALTIFETDWLAQKSDIAKKLQDLNVSSTAYGTRWYLTLFNMSIPFAAQLRVWDVFMLLGDAPLYTRGRVRSTKTGNMVEEDFGGADLDVLHAVSAALVDAVQEILIVSDFENTMKTLTSWIPVQDEDLLMNVAKEEYRVKKKRKG